MPDIASQIISLPVIEEPRLAGMSIVQCLANLEDAGAARSVVDVARALKRSEAQCHLLAAGGVLLNEALHAGARYHVRPRRNNSLLGRFFAPGWYRRHLSAAEADLVHIHDNQDMGSVLKSAAALGSTTVVTVADIPMVSGTELERASAILHQANHVVVVSKYVARFISGLGIAADKVTVIPRGVDLIQFDPGAVKSARIVDLAQRWGTPDGVSVMLVRFARADDPGLIMLFEALKLLNRTDILVYIIGVEKAGLASLESRVAAMALGGQVRLMDSGEDLPAVYMLADVVVVPDAKPPAFGRAALEAHAMGRPVVAFDHGGVRDIVRHEETGWLVKPNELQALAAALGRALTLEADDRQAMAHAARARAENHYGRDVMVRQTLSLYARLLDH